MICNRVHPQLLVLQISFHLCQVRCHRKGHEEKPGISHPIDRDIGHHYLNASNLTDKEKYELLTNSSKLDCDYCLPPNSSGHKFQVKWLTEFPWLAYSRSMDGAFCLHCVLFSSTETSHNASKLDRLYRSPFKTWSNGPRKLRTTATLKASHYKQCMAQKDNSVDIQLNSIVNKQIEQNRKKLVPIVGAVKPGFHIVAAVAGVARIAERLAQRPKRLYGNKLIYFAGDPQRPSATLATQSLGSLKFPLSDPRLSAFKEFF